MSWFDLFRRGRKSASSYDILREIAGMMRRSISGKSVTTETALEVAAVFACLRVLGNGMAQVPLKLMRETANGTRVTRLPAREHRLYSLLATKPNSWQTSFEFRQLISWHVELAGQAFVYLSRSSRDDSILELIPIEPGRVTVKQADDLTLTYWVRSKGGEEKPFASSLIWHIRGPSWNGWTAIPVIQAAREAIGLAIAAEESQAALHVNGVRPSGVYSVEGKLDPQQYKALRDHIVAENSGSSKDGSFMLLDRAAKWVNTQMTGVDAQHLETRREQIAEVCRYFGVFPIMAGYSDKATTYASAEQMFLAHAMHTLSPRWTMFEQSADANLLTEEDRAEGLYFDFVEEGMIRGNVKDTKDAILGYVNGGVMTPNEGRAKLDLNPDDDPESDKLRIPVNVAQEPPARADEEGGPPA